MLLWALIFCFLESTDDWAQHYPNHWLDGKNCTHKSYTWFALNPMYPLFARFQLEGVDKGSHWIRKRFPDFHHGEWWNKIWPLDKYNYRVFSSAVLFMGSNKQFQNHKLSILTKIFHMTFFLICWSDFNSKNKFLA